MGRDILDKTKYQIWGQSHASNPFIRDGPVFFFLAFLCPGSAGVRRGEEKKRASINIFIQVCHIFYSTWNLKWWSGDSPSQVEKKINFFLTFIAHVLRKEIWFDLNAVKGNFHLFNVKGDVFAVKGNFAMKGDLQILSIMKDKNYDFFVFLKKYKIQ